MQLKSKSTWLKIVQGKFCCAILLLVLLHFLKNANLNVNKNVLQMANLVNNHKLITQ